MTEVITYEYPLNERARLMLRLEQRVNKLLHFSKEESDHASRAAIEALLECMDITDRVELKTEIMLELERYQSNLNRLAQTPGVDHDTLNRVLEELGKSLNALSRAPGRLDDILRKDGFLKTLKQRLSIPGGACCFDLPYFHYWLNQPVKYRHEAIQAWITHFQPLLQAVQLFLRLNRESQALREKTAEHGQFSYDLPSDKQYQMIRVQVDKKIQAVAEISGSKHRVNVRFLNPKGDQRGTLLNVSVPFSMSCCGL